MLKKRIEHAKAKQSIKVVAVRGFRLLHLVVILRDEVVQFKLYIYKVYKEDLQYS